MHSQTRIDDVAAAAYRIPTETPEADGTLQWTATTLVVVRVRAAGQVGLGYTYNAAAAAELIRTELTPLLLHEDAFDIPAMHRSMQRQVRNIGRSGLAATAVAAVDVALWDLKAKILDVPLATLLGPVRRQVPVYGSGGFTNYEEPQLVEQLAGWVEDEGCRWVKMKVGQHPAEDPNRIKAARRAIGQVPLFVDANGAFGPAQAVHFASMCQAYGVTWFEEPVSSDDLAGLRQVRQRIPVGIEVAAGEYSYNLDDVARMLAAGAVDVQQVDATRCLGITGFLAAGALCEAYHTDLSGHCAPSLHLHAACAVPRLRHLEYFFDHVRIEHMLFDGAARARNGLIEPDWTRPGIGLELKESDARRYLAEAGR
ncbi:MAG TPA: enolase C-terminal domain-like protein [Steroidobacteraceae bacterium]|nr:enolase C-terminal domain-like protein [Steroidobacteraceae bacterium]